MKFVEAFVESLGQMRCWRVPNIAHSCKGTFTKSTCFRTDSSFAYDMSCVEVAQSSVLQQTMVIEFQIVNQQCEDCQKSEPKSFKF